MGAGLARARFRRDHRALYADGAHFRSHPFREPEVPRAYIERVLAEEESAECAFGEPLVAAASAASAPASTRVRQDEDEDDDGREDEQSKQHPPRADVKRVHHVLTVPCFETRKRTPDGRRRRPA